MSSEQQRSAEHCLSEAENRATAMFGRRSGSAFVQVAGEYARYRQAFDYFSDRGDAERAARFVTALRDYW